MRVTPLMIVTAVMETGTGLLLVAWPALLFTLLFGWRQVAPETLLIGRVAGAAVISIGVASWPDDGSEVDDVVTCADERLYEAKRRGRDRTVGPPASQRRLDDKGRLGAGPPELASPA